MEPQEVQTEAEQSKPKGDTLAGEGAESAEGGRPPDGTAGETKQESLDGSDESPPMQNGMSPQVSDPNARQPCDLRACAQKNAAVGIQVHSAFVLLQRPQNHG